MRYALAIGVLAVALAAAVYVHQRNPSHPRCVADLQPGQACPPGGMLMSRYHPSWEDPAAVLLGLGGLAIAVGIAATGRLRQHP